MVIDILGTAVSLNAPESVKAELFGLTCDLEVDAVPVRSLSIEPDTDGMMRLIDTGTVVRTGFAPVVAAPTAIWWLNALAIEVAPHILIHAACVGSRSAVLIPGPSGAGKSTLAAACVVGGLAYLSDEFAALDRGDGMAWPYARPLEVSHAGLIAASTLRPGSVGTPLPPAGIVFPKYQAGASHSLVALDPGWTFLALLTHAPNLRRLGPAAIPWIAALATAVPAWHLTYSDTDDAEHVVSELAAEPGIPLQPAKPVAPVTATTITVPIGDHAGVFEIDTHRVHLLNSSAAAVWSVVGEIGSPSPSTSDVLASTSDGSLDRATVGATIQQLRELGLLPSRGR